MHPSEGSLHSSNSPLVIGFIEPHLRCFGGIRRIIELSNRLTNRGHDVRIYVPETETLECQWMRCTATVKTIRRGLADDLDVVLANHEPQWHLLFAFRNARSRVFYALHYGRLYGKSGSWESLRAPADLFLANSNWTADQIAAETGHRPLVLSGGINRQHFYPVGVPKAYPLLCVGDEREWKGTEVIRKAAELLQLPLEEYAHKGLRQEEMATEYCRADIFVVGSRFEGFGQPGLEAMACGVPLVTTDNGGCRDYAIHEETALLVPPDDPEAMANAIGRLRRDPVLADHLVRNGLEKVERDFDWERSTDRLENALRRAAARPGGPPLSNARAMQSHRASPDLSIVLLAWDQLHLTQACVESIRRHTDVSYELIIVDNGSSWEAANYAAHAADKPIMNPRNLGFAHGMNQGLELAAGRHIVFLNNDTVLPSGWAERLTRHLADEHVGIVVPAITAASNPRTVRDSPGDAVEVVDAFDAPPAAVLYAMNTDKARRLGGWGEEYLIASGEDVDLCFKVWCNGLSVVFDSTVLVQHVSKGTAGTKLIDWRKIWQRNRTIFLDKWTDPTSPIPKLAECTPGAFKENRQTARVVALWMKRYFETRDRQRTAPSKGTALRNRAPYEGSGVSPRLRMSGAAFVKLARFMWPRVRDFVPIAVRRALFRRYKQQYYLVFPERRAA